MTWGFETGRVYNRRKDVHSKLGGNQQSGISYRKGGSTIFFVTGESGEKAGYEDRWRADGVFEYCGEGQVGAQVFTKGNLEIRDHVLNGKQLLMFSQASKGFIRFEGEMICESYGWRDLPDRDGNIRPAIIFSLRPLEAVEEKAEETASAPEADIAALRKRALAAAETPAPTSEAKPRTIYQRSRDVRAYVLARAKGVCEGCEKEAPFIRVDGTPYLEPHHLRRISDGGPDDPRFVIGICPNCHRQVHHGIDGVEYNTALLEKMKSIEPAT